MASKKPAIIAKDKQGFPYSPLYKDIYASRDGAVKQAEHVFLKGSRLPERWQDRASFAILENGFGIGTNFLVTLREWRKDPRRTNRLHYVAIEGHPVCKEDLLEYIDPSLKDLAVELSDKWPQRTPGVHRIYFDDGKVVLTLFFEDVTKAAKNLTGSFDAFYLDGFSPSKNPAMWQKRIFNEFAKHASPDATVSTWCVASEVRKALHNVGFEVHKEKGFGHKSEMTVGTFNPHWKHERSHLEKPASIPLENREVLIIGAGTAGAALASEFSSRKWKVTVVDDGAVAASGASAIRWAFIHSQYSADDNLLFRLTRAGLEAASRKLEEFPDLSELSGLHGLFQVTRSDEEAAKWKKLFADFEVPGILPDFISFHDKKEGTALTGLPIKRAGILHHGAGLVALGQWTRERLAKAGVDLRLNQSVESLKFKDGNWKAIGSYGETIAKAPYCVVAAGAESQRLVSKSLPITRWLGRISLLPERPFKDTSAKSVIGPGYLILKDGLIGAGATYENIDAEGTLSDQEAHEHNFGQLARFLKDTDGLVGSGFYKGIRAVAPDRMPYIGRAPVAENESLEGRDKLYVSCAFGSRGAVLSDLAAQIITGMIYGEPLPVEKDLIAAVDPNRFA